MSKKITANQRGSIPLILLILTLVYSAITFSGFMVKTASVNLINSGKKQHSQLMLARKVQHIFASPARCPLLLNELVTKLSASARRTFWTAQLKTEVTGVAMVNLGDRESLSFKLKESAIGIDVPFYFTREGNKIISCSTFPPADGGGVGPNSIPLSGGLNNYSMATSQAMDYPTFAFELPDDLNAGSESNP